jgi:type I restriction enzyme S subunit
MEVKAGYKETEAGVIPEDWEVAAIDSLGRRGRPAVKAGPFGSSLTKNTYVAEGYKVYGQEQVIRGDHLYGDYYVSKERFNELRSCAVEPGDILLSLVGTAGRVLVIPPGAPEGIINPRLIRFSFDPNVISPTYFRFLFETDAYQALLARNAQGGTMGVLNAGLLRPIRIPLPRVPEQIAIAAALSDVDALINNTEKLIAKKRTIKQGAMQLLLTGKKRLPGFTGEWEVKTFEDIADRNVKWSITGGPFGSNLKASDYTSEGVRIIQLQNIGDGIFNDEYKIFTSTEKADELLSCNIYPGEIILSKMGDPVARACFVPCADKRFLMSSDGIRLVVNENTFHKKFVHDYINSIYFRQKAIDASTGTTRQRIGLDDLKKLSFICPSLSEQTAIARVLSDMDAEIEGLEHKLAKYKLIKQGMMQELLTGKKRLI